MRLYFVVLIISTNFVFSSTLTIKADKILFQEGVIISSGNVEIKFPPFEVKCNEVKITTPTSTIECRGSVKINDGHNLMSCDGFIYNYDTMSGTMQNINGKFGDWYIKSKKLKNKATEVYHLSDLWVTSCDREKPHYFFSTKSGKIYPGKSVHIKNAIFKTHFLPFPLLYLPYWYQPLDRKDYLEIHPGYRNGLTLKIIYGFPVWKQHYAKLFLDYYPNGLGKGGELNYRLPFADGTIYLYHIKEKFDRWRIFVSHQHRIMKNLNARLNLNFQSDPDFNNLYFTEDWNRRNISLSSNVIIDYTTKNAFLKSIIESQNLYSEGRYRMNKIVLPSITFGLVSLPLLGLKADFNNSLKYEIYEVPSFEDTVTLSLYRDLRMGYYSLLPKMNLYGTFGYKNNVWTSVYRYSFLPSFGLRLFQFYKATLYYNYTMNLTLNKQERNTLRCDFYIFPFARSELRISPTYDFLTSTFLPLITEFRINIDRFTFYLIPTVNLYPLMLDSVSLDFSKMFNSHDSISVSYIHRLKPLDIYSRISLKKRFINGTSISLSFSPSYKDRKFNIVENSIDIYFDLHCWELKLRYTKRPGLEESQIYLGLKLESQRKKMLLMEEHERKYYQWR